MESLSHFSESVDDDAIQDVEWENVHENEERNVEHKLAEVPVCVAFFHFDEHVPESSEAPQALASDKHEALQQVLAVWNASWRSNPACQVVCCQDWVTENGESDQRQGHEQLFEPESDGPHEVVGSVRNEYNSQNLKSVEEGSDHSPEKAR